MRARDLKAAAVVLCSLGSASGPAGAQDGERGALPAPTGPYAVGRILEDWVDEGRADPLAPDPTIPRELPVAIWYPAERSDAQSAASYFPDPLRDAFVERASANPNAPGAAYGAIIATLRAHAVDGAPLADAAPRYPVVLMKPALGFFALQYTVLAEDLASHGYVVVGSDSPYTSPFVVYSDGRQVARTDIGAGRGGEGEGPHELAPGAPNGRQLPAHDVWVADDAFLLNRLTALDAADPAGRFQGRLDLEAVGAVGHSFGGSTSLDFCHLDVRCDAAINIDGAPLGLVTRDGSEKPSLLLWSDRPIWEKPEGERAEEERALFAALGRIRSLLPNQPNALILDGAAHFNFSDSALHSDLTMTRQMGALGPIEPARALAATNAIARVFLDAHLKGDAGASIEEVVAAYPEIRILP